MTSSSSTFDPYLVWLGISERPIDHYRLLGISRHEVDATAIHNATARLLPYLEALRSTEHAEDAGRLYDEVLAAEACLICADRRREYDRQLSGEVASPVSAADESVARPADSTTIPSESPAQPAPTQSVQLSNRGSIPDSEFEAIEVGTGPVSCAPLMPPPRKSAADPVPAPATVQSCQRTPGAGPLDCGPSPAGLPMQRQFEIHPQPVNNDAWGDSSLAGRGPVQSPSPSPAEPPGGYEFMSYTPAAVNPVPPPNLHPGVVGYPPAAGPPFGHGASVPLPAASWQDRLNVPATYSPSVPQVPGGPPVGAAMGPMARVPISGAPGWHVGGSTGDAAPMLAGVPSPTDRVHRSSSPSPTVAVSLGVTVVAAVVALLLIAKNQPDHPADSNRQVANAAPAVTEPRREAESRPAPPPAPGEPGGTAPESTTAPEPAAESNPASPVDPEPVLEPATSPAPEPESQPISRPAPVAQPDPVSRPEPIVQPEPSSPPKPTLDELVGLSVPRTPRPTPAPRTGSQPAGSAPGGLVKALEAARYAMSRRDLDEALIHLEQAEQLAGDGPWGDEVTRLGMLHDNLKQFFHAVSESSRSLQGFQELRVGQIRPRIAVVVEATADRLVLKDQGVNRRFSIRDNMPATLCELLARRWLSGNQAANEVLIGSFFAMDADGDPERARQLWSSARSGSDELRAMVDQLLPELARE